MPPSACSPAINSPDHSRISDFRLVHLDALAGLFVQVLRQCQKAGLVSLVGV
jgi:transposase